VNAEQQDLDSRLRSFYPSLDRIYDDAKFACLWIFSGFSIAEGSLIGLLVVCCYCRRLLCVSRLFG